MRRLMLPKDDPKKLRMRAEELELKSATLANEADKLFERAEQIESGRNAPRKKLRDYAAKS
jgi:hypothetical protein